MHTKQPLFHASLRAQNSTKCRVLLKLICFAVFCSLLYATVQQANIGGDAVPELRFALQNCMVFTGPIESGGNESTTMPHQVQDMLSLVEHIFVISMYGCETRFSSQSLTSRSTCVHGKVLDECTPRKFITGGFLHAMKVTFTHAAIVTLSIDAGYKTIAVVEDDLSFLDRDLSREAAEKFARLLQSNAWNMIRFGFRPYFLQQNGVSPCPKGCRCTTGNEYGEHFCELKSPGCDMRSSDLYVLPSHNFLGLRDLLLDLKKTNTKRIIDVHPMRAYGNQWIFLPQISYQRKLDIPADYQVGAGALYVKKCVGPRPVPSLVSNQLVKETKRTAPA